MPDVPRILCPYCRESIAATATKCRFCNSALIDRLEPQQPPRPQSQALSGLTIALGVAAGMAIFCVVGCVGCIILVGSTANQMNSPEFRRSVEESMKENSLSVARDFEQQYDMARRNLGTGEDAQIELHVKAGLVAEGYLSAGDEGNYQKWKAIADQHGKAAGLP